MRGGLIDSIRMRIGTAEDGLNHKGQLEIKLEGMDLGKDTYMSIHRETLTKALEEAFVLGIARYKFLMDSERARL